MKTPALVIFVSLLVAPVVLADEVRLNDTDGFSIYSNDGEYLGRVVPNDTGGYDVRALDGRKVDSVDSTGDADADLLILNDLAGEEAEGID